MYKKDDNVIISKMMISNKENLNDKSYSEIGVEKIIQQFFQLIMLTDESIETVSFIKNRNPISKIIHMAQVAKVIGNEEINDTILGKDIFYSDYPKWRSIPDNKGYLTEYLPKKCAPPFSFDTEMSLLVIPIKSKTHNWGSLICMSHGHIKNWSTQLISISKSFSNLINELFLYSYKHEKNSFLIKNIERQLQNKTELIISLQKSIKSKNETISKLENNEQKAQFTWENSTDVYDEVWLTIHAFKDGSPEPIVSKWERITDNNMLNKIKDLFFKKSVCSLSN